MTADTLVTTFVLNAQPYVAGGRQVSATTTKIGADIDHTKGKLKGFQSEMTQGFGRFFSVLQTGATVGAAFTMSMVAVGAAILSASWAAAEKAANFEALENSLKAVEGNANAATKELRTLTELSKMPGIDIEGAIKGYVGLRFAGMDQGASNELIRQSGNANAVAGGGREQFDQIMRALKQISVKEFLQGDELLQLSEAGLPAVQWIKAAFGTADTEKLKKAGIDSKLVLEALTLAMQEIPRATGGAKNSIENFRIAVDQAQIGFGKGIIEGLFGELDDFTNAITDLIDAGTFKWFGEAIAGQIGSALGLIQTGDVRRDMIELMGVFVQLGSATRNFFMQLGRIIDIISLGLGPGAEIAKKLLSSGAPDPMGERTKFVETANKQLEAFDQAEAKRKAEKAAEDAARQAKLDAQRAVFEAKRGAAKDRIKALGEKPEKDEAVRHLRNIDVATTKLANLTTAVFGGSELGKMGSPAREAQDIRRGGGGSGGRGGTKIQQAVSLIEEHVMELLGSGVAAQLAFRR